MSILKRLLAITALSFLLVSCATLSENSGSHDPYANISFEDDLLSGGNERPIAAAVIKEVVETPSPVIAEVEESEMVASRAPASVIATPSRNVSMIMYTPLWIKIPASECTKVIENHHYAGGACIQRRQ